tara:strand:+ start:432 stop:1439 length:1008 start_codon:yes stop_codon:yes gene_type:complete
MENYKNIQKQKYLIYKLNKKKEKYKSVLQTYSDDEIDIIINNDYINKIELFYKRYNLNNKELNYCDSCEEKDILRIKERNEINGYNYLKILKNFDLNGFKNIKFQDMIDIFNVRRINKFIKNKSNYKYIDKKKFYNYDGIINNFNGNWNINNFLQILENKGLQKLSVPKIIFDMLLEQEPGVYAIEIITNDLINLNRSYCIINDFPSDQDILDIPLEVCNQLKLKSEFDNFNIRLVKPKKGERVKLKCLINRDDIFNDIKVQMTEEISKLSILSLNQIISIKSDKEDLYVPFLVKELSPSNVIDITNIDLEIDFDICEDYENPLDSLFIYSNMEV